MFCHLVYDPDHPGDETLATYYNFVCPNVRCESVHDVSTCHYCEEWGDCSTCLNVSCPENSSNE